MIVVEGPDMVGKTTLCWKIAEALRKRRRFREGDDAHVVKFDSLQSAYPPQSYSEVVRPWLVADRMHLSEVAYGTVVRGACNLDPVRYGMVDAAVEAVGGMVVVVWADEDDYAKLCDAHHARGEQFNPEQCASVARWYADLGKMARRAAALKNRRVSHGRYVVRVSAQFQVRELEGVMVHPGSEFVSQVVREYEKQQVMRCTTAGNHGEIMEEL